MPDYPVEKVLAFLIDVFAEAEHSPGGQLNVIPALIVDDLSTVVPLVNEICRYAGYQLQRAELAADGIPIDDAADVHGVLKATVEAIAVDPSASGTPVPLVVRTDEGLLRVRIGPDGEAPTNPGDRNQLGLLTAILNPRLGTMKLDVIVYDETDVAQDSRDRNWALLLDTLPAVGTATNTLLVLLGASRVDYDRHCREGTGIRWAFQGGEVWQRQRSQTGAADVARLASGDGPLIFMLGAGLSASSGLPLGNHLRDEALARLLPNLANDGRSVDEQATELYAQLRERKRLLPSEEHMSPEEFVRELTLERVLREEARIFTEGTLPTLTSFDEHQKAVLDRPGPAIRDLKDLLHLRSRLVLLTVNFDQLIEHGTIVLGPEDPDPYEADQPPTHGRPAVRLFVTESDFDKFPEYYVRYCGQGGAVPLVKLHGTIDQPDTVRANVDDTLSGLSESAKNLLEALVPDPGDSAPWTYVGCSMRDPDITRVTGTGAFAERCFERWVSPLIDPNVERWTVAHRDPVWTQRKKPPLQERVITQTADTFMSALRRELLPESPGAEARPVTLGAER